MAQQSAIARGQQGGDEVPILGEQFRQRFEALRAKCPLIADVRILGAMIGVELPVEGVPFVEQCLRRQLLINCTHSTVIRLLPAVNLPDDLIDEGCEILADVLLNHNP